MVQKTLQNEKLIDCSKEHPRKEKTDVGKSAGKVFCSLPLLNIV